jgi:hypothetical protein
MAATRLTGGPVDRHALVLQADVADRHGNRFLPAQAGEGEDHRHVPEACLEVIEGGSQAKHLRDARDDHAAPNRPAPAGAQLKR